MKLIAMIITAAQFAVLNLGGNWEFKSNVEQNWHTGKVPGCVHLDLMQEGIIPDPFYGQNEDKVQWVGEKDWTYKRTFTVGKDILEGEHQTLVMEGIDTYAEVFLNGRSIASCDNMFRTWKIDVKGMLNEGENLIELRFESVFRHDMPKYLAAPYRLMACANNDQSDIWLSVYARKAGYNYGWDWGPRLITTGIWKDIRIESWSDLIVRPSQIKTVDITDSKKAKMQAIVEFESDVETKAGICICTNGKVLVRHNAEVRKGVNKEVVDFIVRDPKLWWSNGLGGQPLYDFVITVSTAAATSSRTETCGIRTIEVNREPDKYGKALTVRLNGVDVFCKGANYIPSDNFPTRVDADKYDRVVEDARRANMNMLRIWGGGIFENDEFYAACDRKGILIWHDMMFACGMFPSDAAYLESVSNEVRDNVRRLRNHPSIALWCGNNECDAAFYAWGWKRMLSPEHAMEYEAGYLHLFRELIPESIADVDNTRYYHPSSPNTGYNDIGGNMGDSHYWAVWKGARVENYLKEETIARFMSEYGFQAYPCMETIREYIPEYDRYVGSDTMIAHQKAHHDVTHDPHFGDRMIKMYMEQNYTVPEKFEDFVYLSQLQQAEAVKLAIEAHRRAKPYCMGTLYWQINDCWPVASWASIDYRGRWKALQFYAAKAYREILVSPYVNSQGENAIKVVSDRLSGIKADLEINVIGLDGTKISQKTVALNLEPQACVDAAIVDVADNAVVYCRVLEKGRCITENFWFKEFSNTYRYIHAEPKVRINDNIITLDSDVVMRGVHLYSDDPGLKLSDDYVTLIPGYPVVIEVLEGSASGLETMSLNNIQ